MPLQLTTAPIWHNLQSTPLQTFVSSIAQPDGFPDAMPSHVAMQQLDQVKFVEAMEKDLQQHAELKHWKIVHHSQVPKNAHPIPMVWALHCKCNPAGNIIKWKTLCLQPLSSHRDTYWTTFAPVVLWTTVHCISL